MLLLETSSWILNSYAKNSKTDSNLIFEFVLKSCDPIVLLRMYSFYISLKVYGLLCSLYSTCHFCSIPLILLSSLDLPPSDVPTESHLSTSPFISSLSLSGSEDNIGKKLLRKLSEWAYLSPTPVWQHTHTYRQMCANFSVRRTNSVGCILATGDVLCPWLQPTPSCRARSPDAAVPVGSDTIWHIYLFIRDVISV